MNPLTPAVRTVPPPHPPFCPFPFVPGNEHPPPPPPPIAVTSDPNVVFPPCPPGCPGAPPAPIVIAYVPDKVESV